MPDAIDEGKAFGCGRGWFCGDGDVEATGQNDSSHPNPLSKEHVGEDFIGAGTFGPGFYVIKPEVGCPKVVFKIHRLNHVEILLFIDVRCVVMRQSELVSASIVRVDGLTERFKRAFENLTEEQINQPIPGHDWTLAGIVDHMLLAHRPYLAAVEPLVGMARAADVEARASFFGGLIAGGMMRPGVPAPPSSRPKESHYSLAILEEWEAVHAQIRLVMEQLSGSELQQKFPNPFIGIVKFNIVDFLQVVPGHMERHIAQIEERRSLV